MISSRWTYLHCDLLSIENDYGGRLKMKPVVIIGAVAAGMSAASVIKRGLEEAEVIVFGKEAYISYGA
jgi:hypothetical protein